MPPAVSIVTPTANRDNYLPALARCVMRQQVSWEWLVLDDSPEPSRFMRDLAGSDRRIRYTHLSEPMSIGAKRNRLIDMAEASVIAHFDDDDHYASHYLARMVGLLDECGADLVKLSGFYVHAPAYDFLGYLDLNARVGLHYVLTRGDISCVEFRHGKATIAPDFLLFYGFSYVYRRAVAAATRFEDVSFCEDEKFLRRLVEAEAKVIAVDDQIQSCLHVVHPNSTSRCFSRYMLPSFMMGRLFPEAEPPPAR